MKKKSTRYLMGLILIYLSQLLWAQSKIEFDIVLQGGRVIDPETELDAIRNVGIVSGQVKEISILPLVGKEVVDVSGKVVVPGFIDLHVHGRTNQEQEYQVHDGVTTALELEYGIEFLKKWYGWRRSKALINYGASANWAFARFMTMKDDKNRERLEALQNVTEEGNWHLESMLDHIQPSYNNSLSSKQVDEMLTNIRTLLGDGALGVGIPVGYIPGATVEEVHRLYELAGDLQIPIFTHVRAGGLIAVQQAISDAVLTDAPLHIVHVNSMVLSEIEVAIEMVNKANNKGFDITTELYPYTAASTTLQSAFFDEGWQTRLGISYEDLQWVETGERLTQKTFYSYRKKGGVVIIHMMQPEWIETGISSDRTMIASDGMPYAKLAHPRTAGTFSRVIAKYVREKETLTLNEAIRKMTLLPAQRLEKISPMMRYKGRLQVGMDADITIFDFDKITDKSSFDQGLKFSEGIDFVLVNGVFVIKGGEIEKDVFPGLPIVGKFKN